MKFEINSLANEFKNTIPWMLENEHGSEIEDFIQELIRNKDKFSRNPDYIKALETLIELIVTQSWYYRKPENFDNEMAVFRAKFEKNVRISEAQSELINIVEKTAPQWIQNNAMKKIQELLKILNNSTIKQFSDQLYTSAVQGKNNIKVLGEKGRDNYLRDFGYWDRIPMDRHEMRFIVRTGIYHTCSKNEKSDPLQKSSLHDSLTDFCSNYLKGYSINGIDLGDAPGIADVFIWWFSAKKEYDICGSTPKCLECTFNDVCLYAIINQLPLNPKR